uniref:uncharacterized protein LOC117608987 n=1 Tax=Osmia lignaria TaxID=473952 RepID=UPI001478A5FB|nr:uncharacterized protein LOC117608987 [Osmia lignaria]
MGDVENFPPLQEQHETFFFKFSGEISTTILSLARTEATSSFQDNGSLRSVPFHFINHFLFQEEQVIKIKSSFLPLKVLTDVEQQQVLPVYPGRNERKKKKRSHLLFNEAESVGQRLIVQRLELMKRRRRRDSRAIN